MENIEYALPALDLIDEILEMMNSYKMHLYEPVVDELKQAV